jgi:DNA-binding FadR family transcriptional regulator
MSSRAEQSAYRLKPEGKSMHGRIVRELGLRILSGDLPPGDRLPSESELIALYEVSRPVLREAVRVLVAKGLVISRQRSGSVVRPRNEWHLLDPDVLYWMIQTKPAPEFVQTLMGMRRVFEPAVPRRWPRSAASDEQIASIAEAYAGMARPARRRHCWSPTSRSIAASRRPPATT